jgi:hypothetical protein
MRGMGIRPDARTKAQLETIHTLLAEHDRIARNVTHLPNGIRTVIESADPKIAQLIKTHRRRNGKTRRRRR